MSNKNPFRISPDELQSRLGENQLSIVDSSWYLPAQGRDADAEYADLRIPGAVRFDIDVIRNRDSTLPHMLPTPEDFAEHVGKLGIANDHEIIVYDGPGVFSAPRAWWMFRIMGAPRVRILDHGLDGWVAAGRPIERGPPHSPEPARFIPKFDEHSVWSIDQMRANLKTGEALVLDARPFERFAGTAPEPRPGLRAGHIPGSRSLPFTELVENGRFRDKEELRRILGERDVASNRRIVTSCGSGVTAAAISLALASIGHEDHALYDGSWAEWGAEDGLPVACWTQDEEGKQ